MNKSKKITYTLVKYLFTIHLNINLTPIKMYSKIEF